MNEAFSANEASSGGTGAPVGVEEGGTSLPPLSGVGELARADSAPTRSASGGLFKGIVRFFLALPTLKPVLNRELIASLRRGRAFLWLTAYLLVFFFLFANQYVTRYEEISSVGDRTWFSRRIFAFYSTIQIAAFGFIALLGGSRQISSERQKRTLDLLLTTPLACWTIILSKTLASVGFALLLAVATLPFYSICFMLGGVGWWDLMIAVYLTLLTGLTYAMIGVAASASPRQGQSKNQGGGFYMLALLNGGIALLVMAVLFIIKVPENDIENIVTSVFILLSPPAVFMNGLFYPTSEQLLLTAGHSLVEIGLFLLFLWLGVRRLRKESVVAVPHSESETKGEKGPRRIGRITIPRLFPIPDWLNPVTAKELGLSIPRRRGGQLAVVFLLGAFFFLGAWGLVGTFRYIPEHARAVYDGMLLSVVALALLVIMLRASGVVASEREAGTLRDLVLTPMRPVEVLRGKLIAVIAGVLAVVGPPGLALVLLYCVFFPANMIHALVYLPLAALALVASGAMYGAFALGVSASARTARAAGNRMALIALAVYVVGTPLLGAMASRIEAGAGSKAAGVFAGFLVSIFFPAVLPFASELDIPRGEILACWVAYFVGLAISCGLARVWLRGAALIYERESIREQSEAKGGR